MFLIFKNFKFYSENWMHKKYIKLKLKAFSITNELKSNLFFIASDSKFLLNFTEK